MRAVLAQIAQTGGVVGRPGEWADPCGVLAYCQHAAVGVLQGWELWVGTHAVQRLAGYVRARVYSQGASGQGRQPLE